MQINIVEGGSPALFNAMLFPEATPETKSWLEEQWTRDSGMLTDMGRQFMSTAKEYWEKIYDPNLQRRVRSMARSVGGMLHPNRIVDIDSIAGIQKAKPVMQRYIMAMPDIRRLYHEQLCDGYSDSYVDLEPGKVGEEHYDYRRVMSGIVQDTVDDDGEAGWKSTVWHEDLHEGDRELEKDEQFAILGSWDLVRLAMGLKIDSTDIFNGKLEI